MRKTIIVCTTIICAIFISVIGCKKDLRQDEKAQPAKTEQIENTAARAADNIYESEYGFLVFPNIEDLEDYRDLILASTHAEIQDYLATKGFSETVTLGATIYDEEFANQTVTEEQAIDYVINTNRIVEIKDVVMKPIGETECETVKWEFLLAMKAENLDSTRHGYLQNDTYDENTMNKFATNPSEETQNLFDFMEVTPYGYEETVANGCPEAEEARRPFIGREDGYCNWWYEFNPATGQNDKVVSYGCEKGALYIFFIKFDDGQGCGFGDNKCLDF